VVDNVIVQ